MEKEYEKEKKRLKDRYQVRKKRYEGRYKAEEIKPETPTPAPPSAEEVVEEEKKPEVQTVVEEEVVEPGLTDIEGIGATRAAKLEAAGIMTIKDLAGAIPQEIAEIADVSNIVASDWIRKAEDAEQYK